MKREIQAFRQKHLLREGWDLIPDLLPSTLISSVTNTFEQLIKSNRNPSTQILFTHNEPPEDTPPLSSIMTQWLNPWRWEEFPEKENCKILKHILFGEESNDWLLFQEILFMKQPNQGDFHWHQDMPFFPLDNSDGVTCWIAFDKCTKENGALMIAPRSHLSGSLVSINLHTGKSQDGNGFSFVQKDFNIVQPILNPGDALLFHPCTFHASAKNLTKLPRRAWATVWFRKGVKFKRQNAPNHPMWKDVKDGSIVQGIL